MDNDRNDSTVYAENMAYVPVQGARTSIVINSTKPPKTNISSGTDLSLRHDKKTSNYEKLPSNSTNQSHTYYRSLTCKNILTVLAVSLLSLLVIAALILPNVLLYLMLPIICKLTINIF
jgi:hypothetical protein